MRLFLKNSLKRFIGKGIQENARDMFGGFSRESLGGSFLLTVGVFCLQLSFLAYSPLRRLLDALSHSKQKIQLYVKKQNYKKKLPNTAVSKKLVTGKYGCTEVRVDPAERGEQLGRDPSKKWELQIPWFNPFLSPSLSGIRLYFLRPHFPSPVKNSTVSWKFFQL